MWNAKIVETCILFRCTILIFFSRGKDSVNRFFPPIITFTNTLASRLRRLMIQALHNRVNQLVNMWGWFSLIVITNWNVLGLLRCCSCKKGEKKVIFITRKAMLDKRYAGKKSSWDRLSLSWSFILRKITWKKLLKWFSRFGPGARASTCDNTGKSTFRRLIDSQTNVDVDS